MGSLKRLIKNISISFSKKFNFFIVLTISATKILYSKLPSFVKYRSYSTMVIFHKCTSTYIIQLPEVLIYTQTEWESTSNVNFMV